VVNKFPKLGLKRPDQTRLRASLQAAKYIDVSAVKIPDNAIDWASKSTYDMYRNDRYGCCGPAGVANLVRQISANDGAPVNPTWDDVAAMYRAVGGWNGVDSGNGTDGGVDPLALMNYWRKVGIGGHRIEGYVIIDPNDTALVDACLYMAGGLAIGFDMPTAWQQHIGDVWYGPKNPRNVPAGYERGGWGGHFVVGSTSRDGVRQVATWGTQQKVTTAGFSYYCMFLAMPVSKLWFGADNRSPSGFDAETLLKDLDNIKNGRPVEGPPTKPGYVVPSVIRTPLELAGYKVHTPARANDLFSVST